MIDGRAAGLVVFDSQSPLLSLENFMRRHILSVVALSGFVLLAFGSAEDSNSNRSSSTSSAPKTIQEKSWNMDECDERCACAHLIGEQAASSMKYPVTGPTSSKAYSNCRRKCMEQFGYDVTNWRSSNSICPRK